MKNLHWKLLIPLLLLSGISLYIAKLLSQSLDYPSIFLNLATDFVMVILTVYYVDQVVKVHEHERWERVDYSIIGRIANQLIEVIMNICTPFIDQTLRDELYPKLYDPRGTTPPVEHLYFVWKISRNSAPDFDAKYKRLSEADRVKIYNIGKNCSFILSEILTLYGNRLPPDLLLAIVDTQELIRSFFHEAPDSYPIYLLLRELKNIVEITKFERLEYYIAVEKEPSDPLHRIKGL